MLYVVCVFVCVCVCVVSVSVWVFVAVRVCRKRTDLVSRLLAARLGSVFCGLRCDKIHEMGWGC